MRQSPLRESRRRVAGTGSRKQTKPASITGGKTRHRRAEKDEARDRRAEKDEGPLV
jgi:hypothetical protein